MQRDLLRCAVAN